MLNLPLPKVIPPSDSILTFTPGTYSELVIDTMGSTPPENDPTLAQADDAQVLLSQAGTDLPGASDALGALGDTQKQIVQGQGAQLGADSAAARAKVGTDITDFTANAIVGQVTQITQDQFQTNSNPALPKNTTAIGAPNYTNKPPAAGDPGTTYRFQAFDAPLPAGEFITYGGFSAFATGQSVTAAVIYPADVNRVAVSISLPSADPTFAKQTYLIIEAQVDWLASDPPVQIAVQFDNNPEWLNLYFVP